MPESGQQSRVQQPELNSRSESQQRFSVTSPATDERPQPSPSGISKIYRLLAQAVSHFIDDDCSTMAAALAYYTTFSIAPLLLIVISILGMVLGRQAVEHGIQIQLEGLIGTGVATEVKALVESAGKHSSNGALSATLGILALLFGASGAFAQLQSSLNQIWHVKPDPNSGGIKNFIGHRVLSFGMILAVAFLLLVSLMLSAALAAFGDFVSAIVPRNFSGAMLQVIGFIASLAIIAALFAAIFKILPDVKIVWRNVWVGAGITAVLFEIGKFLIGLYLGHSGTANAYGAAGSLVLLVLWFYYSSMIFLFGAEFTAVWSEAHSAAIIPKPGATGVDIKETVKPEAGHS